MNKKSGKSVTLVAPIQPQNAAEAATAESGETTAAEASAQERTAGAYSPHPYRPVTRESETILEGPPAAMQQSADSTTPTSWIEIELVGEDDRPVPGESYRVQLPDGSVVDGTLDAKGCARIEGFAAGGTCQVSFPYLDQDAWEEL